jgi:hypothetical protein
MISSALLVSPRNIATTRLMKKYVGMWKAVAKV